MPTTTSQHALPSWADLITPDEAWLWRDQKLWHQDKLDEPLIGTHKPGLRARFVNRVYADQNHTPHVRDALERCKKKAQNGWGLNFGSGGTRISERFINLDISPTTTTDIVNTGTRLPFKDDSLDVVVAQEVIEHVDDFFACIHEINRVLKPGGWFYMQCPFQISYHPGPHDYWRFTRDSYTFLFNNESWQLIELKRSLGHGTGFYRIAVEFWAVNASLITQIFYKPTKAACALVFYPLKWLDAFTDKSAEADRIPGGYYCIAQKKERNT